MRAREAGGRTEGWGTTGSKTSNSSGRTRVLNEEEKLEQEQAVEMREKI